MAFIYNLSDTWNDAATTWNGIKLAVTNSGSDSSSKLLNLTVTGASTASFVVDKSGNLALNGTVNKITMTAPATGATLTLADTSTFATSGAYSSTFTFTGTTTLTFPTSGTVTALGNTTTGSGAIVLATSPTLVTPALGTPTSGNFSSGTFTWPTFNQNTTGTAANVTGVVAIANGGTGQTTANAAFNALAPSQGGNSGKYLTTDGSNTSWATNPLGTVTSVDVSGGSTGLSFSGGPITTSGTITMAGTLAAANGGTGLTSLGTGVATWLGTPSSANLAAAVTDETGSGSLVFGTSPTISSPTITGTATFNGSTSGTVAFKAPAIAGTTTFTLPAGNGTSGYVLVTDGLGNTSWASSGGAAGNAAGVDKNVQFNDAGSMAGNAASNFDKSTASLSIGTASVTTGKLAFYNGSTANATTIQAGSASAAVTYTLPTAAPASNGYILSSTTAGAMSWVSNDAGIAVGSSTISGGTSGRVLYDNAGVVGELATTGTGNVVLNTSPSLTTPSLGVASATSVNKVTLTAPATGSTLTIADGKTLTASNTLTFTGTDSSSVAFGTGGTVAYTSNNLSVFASTTSAQLAGVISDETGTGSLVFSNSPTFNDDITLGTQQTTRGSIILANTAAGAYATTLQSSNSATEAWTLTFPTTNGSNGQALITDGNGVTSWGPAGSSITDDTTTNATEYPLFSSVSTGSPSTIYVASTKFTFNPSTGILSSVATSSTNGISLNAMTIAADFTVPTNYNGGSFGPVTIDSGITVTVSSGSTYTVV